MQWQSAHYAVILLQNLHRLPLGLQMRFWLLWLTMQGKQVHTNRGKYTAHTVATRQQMHTISNNNHTICYCSCHCSHTSVQQNYPCSSQSHLPCTAPFRVIQHDHSPCTEVEWCSTCCFSKTNNRDRKDQWREIPNDSTFISPQQRVRAQQRCCTCGVRGILQTSQEETLLSCRSC